MSPFTSTRLAMPGALLAAGLALGCAGAPPPKATPRRSNAPANGVERYMPLKNDTVYAYETETGVAGERGVLMLQVRRTHADLAELVVGGKVQRLEIVKDGIQNLDGGYLLKAPLKLGARWRGAGGEVHVTAVGQAMKVPAGSFVGCVETVEEQFTPPASKRITTVFCPDVGIVRLVVEGRVGSQHAVERAVLRSFGPRIDLGATGN